MQEYKERERSEPGGSQGGWMGQSQDFPTGARDLSPVFDQMLKLLCSELM